MAGRVLDVTAHTTLDYVDGSIRGADWREDGAGVLDVYTPESDPDSVAVAFELDPTATGRVDPHADEVTLTSEQARTLRDALDEAIGPDGSDRPRRLRG